MPFLSSTVERCFAILIYFVGDDVVPFEEHFHHSLVPLPSRSVECCSAVEIRFVRVDVSSEQHFDNVLVPVVSGIEEWCLVEDVWFVGVDVVSCE